MNFPNFPYFNAYVVGQALPEWIAYFVDTA